MKVNLEKIEKDILNILINKRTRCLCGRNEWCSACSPSSFENTVFKEISEYFKELKETD